MYLLSKMVISFKHGYFKEEGEYTIDIKHPNKKKGQNPNPTFFFGGKNRWKIWSQIDSKKRYHPKPIVSISSPSIRKTARSSSRLSEDIPTFCMQHSFLSWPTQLQKPLEKDRWTLNRCFCFFSPNFDFLMETVIPAKSCFTRKNTDFWRLCTQKSSGIWTKFIRFFLENIFLEKSYRISRPKNRPILWYQKPSTFRFPHFHSFHSDRNSHNQSDWIFSKVLLL